MYAASHGAQLRRDAAGGAGRLRSAVLLRPRLASPPPRDKTGHAHAVAAFLAFHPFDYGMKMLISSEAKQMPNRCTG